MDDRRERQADGKCTRPLGHSRRFGRFRPPVGRGRQAIRVHAAPHGRPASPLLLRAVRAERLRHPPARVRRHPELRRQSAGQHGRGHHQVQGAVGRPGRAERRPEDQRPERMHRDALPDQQAGQRVLRLRPQPRRADGPQLARPRAQRPAVHHRRGRLHPRELAT